MAPCICVLVSTEEIMQLKSSEFKHTYTLHGEGLQFWCIFFGLYLFKKFLRMKLNYEVNECIKISVSMHKIVG